MNFGGVDKRSINVQQEVRKRTLSVRQAYRRRLDDPFLSVS
jgi:hypothetical protein